MHFKSAKVFLVSVRIFLMPNKNITLGLLCMFSTDNTTATLKERHWFGYSGRKREGGDLEELRKSVFHIFLFSIY